MRVEYKVALDEVSVPRFSVEAVEGISKLFTLATLVLNVLESKRRVELVFHGLNPEDPGRKLAAFQVIVESSADCPTLAYHVGEGGRVEGASSHFQWVTIERS